MMSTISWPEPRLHVLRNGQKVPDYVQQEKLDQLKNFKLYPDDVWICAYPKCGTHWVSQIARLIKNRGIQDDVRINTAVPWPEMTAPYYEVNILEKAEHPRIYRSHFPYNFLPCGEPHTTPCKYIYITRNPKDVVVSFYWFMKNGWQRDLKFDAFWEMFMKGDVIHGDYFDNLLSWIPHKSDRNVLFLKYEEMKKDLSLTVRKIASFMEIDLPQETFEKIVRLTTFEVMKNDHSTNIAWVRNFQDEEGRSTFLRKGDIGDWKNYLSAEQSAAMDSKCVEKLQGTGFEIDYD